MVPATVPVFFDFACPWSYAGRARELALQKELGVRFEYLPWELSADTPSEGAANPFAKPAGDLVGYARDSGVELHERPRRYNTHRLLAGLFYARAHGRYDEYVDRAFHAYMVEGLNVARDDVLRLVASDAGLDAEGFLAAVSSGAWDAYFGAVDALGEKLAVPTTLTYVVGGQAEQHLGKPEELRAFVKSALA